MFLKFILVVLNCFSVFKLETKQYISINILFCCTQQSMGGYHSPAASGMYPPPPQGPHQWNSYQGPQSTPASSQQQQPGTVPTPSAPFFPPHQIGQGVGGPRFPAERPGSQSRQAISNMLRQRHPGAQQHPGNQFIPGPSQTPATVPGGVSGPGLAAGGAPASTGAHQNMIGNARGPVGPGGAGGGAVGVVAGQQPPFSNLSIVACFAFPWYIYIF